MLLRHDVLPEDGDPIEGVHQGVVVGEAEGGGRGIQGPGKAQPATGDGGGGARVELDNVVELVGVDAIDFSDIEVAVGGAVEEAFEELQHCKPELRREHGAEDALEEGQHPQKGRKRRPKLLHSLPSSKTKSYNKSKKINTKDEETNISLSIQGRWTWIV